MKLRLLAGLTVCAVFAAALMSLPQMPAAVAQDGVPAISSPTSGSVLSCGVVEFTWTDTADEYWVYAGSAKGESDYFDSGLISATNEVITGLPADGSTVWLRLWYRFESAPNWSYLDVEYLSCTYATPTIVSPESGSTLSCGVVEFTWTDTADEYWVYAGSAKGESDYFDSGLILATEQGVSGLPSDSSPVWVRLWYRFDSVSEWSYVDEQYLSCIAVPTMVSPSPGSVLQCGDVEFQWTDTVDEYALFAGSTRGDSDYLFLGPFGDVTEQLVTTLPEDGSVVWIRVWHRTTGQAWRFADFEYTACDAAVGAAPVIVAPVPGSTLECQQADFEWTDTADEYWLYVASEVGGFDYFDSGSLSNTAVLSTGLPDDGSTVWVRLWFRETNGAWAFIDAEFTACDSRPPPTTPTILSPSPGSVAPCGDIEFRWADTADRYRLFVTELPFAHGTLYFDSGTIDEPVTNATRIPANGDRVWVRIRAWDIDGGFNQGVDVEVTTCDANLTAPSYLSPSPGSVLPCGLTHFRWTDTADNYELITGSSPLAFDGFQSGLLDDPTAEVPASAQAGLRVWVRLWYGVENSWDYRDVVFGDCDFSVITRPSLVSPPPGLGLPCGATVFRWADLTDEYWVYVGSEQGGSDHFDSGRLTDSKITVPDLRSNHAWLRLWYRADGGTWQFFDSRLTTCLDL